MLLRLLETARHWRVKSSGWRFSTQLGCRFSFHTSNTFPRGLWVGWGQSCDSPSCSESKAFSHCGVGGRLQVLKTTLVLVLSVKVSYQVAQEAAHSCNKWLLLMSHVLDMVLFCFNLTWKAIPDESFISVRGFPSSWAEPQDRLSGTVLSLLQRVVLALWMCQLDNLKVKYLFVVFGGTASIRMVADADFGRAAQVILKDCRYLPLLVFGPMCTWTVIFKLKMSSTKGNGLRPLEERLSHYFSQSNFVKAFAEHAIPQDGNVFTASLTAV